MNAQQGIDATEFTKSKRLHGSDLQLGQPVEVTLAAVGIEQFDDGTRRLTVEFLETEQTLTLNKSQTTSMIQLFGANTAGWAGQRIALTAVPSSYAGKPTILVTRAAPVMPPTVNGQPMAAAPQPPAADNPWTQPTAGVQFRQG